MAFALALIGCGSQQLPTTSSDAAKRSAQTASLPTVQSSWAIDGDSRPPNWKHATDGDCGTLTFPTDTSLSFAFKKEGTSCMRDQLMPLAGGNLWLLTPSKTYTWKFETVANFGYVPTLVWQIHPATNCRDDIPFVSLNSGPHGSGVAWSANVGGFGGDGYWLQYKGNGSVDTWKVQVLISNGSNASTTMWHNGTKWFTSTKPNYSPGCTAPWWNFGPYVPGWKNPSYHGAVNAVSMRFNHMELSSP
jgi:hypothetical protein